MRMGKLVWNECGWGWGCWWGMSVGGDGVLVGDECGWGWGCWWGMRVGVGWGVDEGVGEV